MFRRGIALLVATLALIVVIVWISKQPRFTPETGAGVLYGHLWCMGVKFDSGEAYAVHDWPDGIHVLPQSIALPAVLVNRAGTVVFREGDRVFVGATLVHVDSGDTACSNLDSLAVDRVRLISSAQSPSPSN